MKNFCPVGVYDYIGGRRYVEVFSNDAYRVFLEVNRPRSYWEVEVWYRLNDGVHTAFGNTAWYCPGTLSGIEAWLLKRFGIKLDLHACARTRVHV